MKKILLAIAKPFVALWNWIKETAWVQPLLIVGCIFAIIFSIPYIVSGIQSLISDDDAFEYLEDNMLSMEDTYKGESEADEFLELYLDVANEWTDIYTGESTSTTAIDSFKKKYGEKMFFVLASSDCDGCSNISEALEYLEDYADDLDLNGEFEFYCIITDEEMDEDEQEDYYEEISAFVQLYNRWPGYFEDIYIAAQRNNYYNNLSDPASFRESLANLMDPDDLEVPVVTVIDLTEENTSRYITTQVFFSVDGETSRTRAIQLTDAWNYNGRIYG